MDGEDQFLDQVLASIPEADVISIFFPLLRRALVVDTRHSEESGHMVGVMPQVSSMDERIKLIEQRRPQFGKVRSILGIPWVRSVRQLDEHGVVDCLVERLHRADMPVQQANTQVRRAVDQLWGLERMAFARMIRGDGYSTLWADKQSKM